jgi:hypothetical protein
MMGHDEAPVLLIGVGHNAAEHRIDSRSMMLADRERSNEFRAGRRYLVVKEKGRATH